MKASRLLAVGVIGGIAALASWGMAVRAEEIRGVIKKIDTARQVMVVTDEATLHDVDVRLNTGTSINDAGGKKSSIAGLKVGMPVMIKSGVTAANVLIEPETSHAVAAVAERSILAEFWYNFRHNLFKPLLLFFYLGFLVPIFRVKFEFPYVIYQGLTIYLLLAIGWHGGEELANLDRGVIGSVLGFMLLGFVTNFFIGVLAYQFLRWGTSLRRIDQATVAGYYGSDSAGTFVTCLGVLASTKIAYDAYMPVMLAVMEIPGCLVALYLVARLRHTGMDPVGNMPDEPGYDPKAARPVTMVMDSEHHAHPTPPVEAEEEMALEKMEHGENGNGNGSKSTSIFTGKLLHEVFLNSGLYLLFGGIVIGFISGLQGPEVTRADDSFFVTLFQGVLCLFLLEMGMTASRKLKDLRAAGWRFIVFGLVSPNIFAVIGITAAHVFSLVTHTPLHLGTYVLFAVLCGAASYIAVPAVQRLAIPEASPTLPLAASLGLTFSYNVTIGIPIYIEVAKLVIKSFPFHA
jgi:hypothetical protein